MKKKNDPGPDADLQVMLIGAHPEMANLWMGTNWGRYRHRGAEKRAW